MKNLSKNLFSALTVVCLIALVIFIVQLFIINRNNESGQTGSFVSEGVSASDREPETDENPFEGYEPPPPPSRPPPQGTRREILIDPDTGANLVIYAPDETFNYIENEFDWRFQHRGGGGAALVISFQHLMLQGAGDGAEDFLNRFAGVSNADYKGLLPILDSQMSGYSVTAQSGSTVYEAWLHRLGDSNLALAFVLSYEFNDQRDELYDVLSSISIEQG